MLNIFIFKYDTDNLASDNLASERINQIYNTNDDDRMNKLMYCTALDHTNTHIQTKLSDVSIYQVSNMLIGVKYINCCDIIVSAMIDTFLGNNVHDLIYLINFIADDVINCDTLESSLTISIPITINKNYDKYHDIISNIKTSEMRKNIYDVKIKTLSIFLEQQKNDQKHSDKNIFNVGIQDIINKFNTDITCNIF